MDGTQPPVAANAPGTVRVPVRLEGSRRRLALGTEAECPCPGGQPRNFLRPVLLLLLSEAPAHGYDLLERLPALGLSADDPGGLYRTLRAMEGEGLLAAEWDTSGRGPARRIYRLTPEGEEQLRAWAVTLRHTRRVLDEFLEHFERVTR